MTGHWKRALSATAGLLMAAGAHAAEVPGGATVKIKAVARGDAFFTSRKELVGLVCAVGAEGLYPQGNSKKWVGGAVKCTDGQDYYFFQVAVQPGDFGVDYASIMGPAAAADGASAVPSGDHAPGARVRIVSISPDDSYIEDAAGIVGQACTVKDATLSPKEDGWYAGQLTCDNGLEYYFYEVELSSLEGGAPAASVVTGTPTASPWAAGKMVKIVDVGAADALAPNKAALVGRTCSVVESPLVDTGEGWFAGRLFCDDGKSYQAFKVKVAAAP